MPAAYRKHPLSFAISLSLAAGLATSGLAASPTPADVPDTRIAATSAPDAAPRASDDDKGTPRKTEAGAKGDEQTLSVVEVVGVRASQERAIETKRQAQNIQDSITAESIGQLPDVTLTDALQRITGVQINRDAGTGTSVDVRGLPEVGTMLNGEVFITPDQIDSQQPDFTMLPATLFRGVDVLKSPTAATTEGGISGALDLHTYRPWDLPSGFTYSYTANGERGDVTDKWGKSASGLISYNGGNWGLLAAGDYSDTKRHNANEGLDQYGVVLNGENAASAGGYNGFLTPWNTAPIPPQIQQNADGTVDVNHDGKSNGVFMGSQNVGLYDITTERKRKSGNASFQMDFGRGFTLTSDYFYASQVQHDRNIGIQFNSTNWQGATYVPLQSRDTGAPVLGSYGTPEPGWDNMHLYTTQVYEKWPGDVESFTQNTRRDSVARNFNVQLDYDNGGPFTGSVRGIRDTARQLNIETDTNISDSDGALWPNVLMDGVPDDAVPPGTMIYPGGNRVFNPTGIPQNMLPIVADFNHRDIGVQLPSTLAHNFADPYGWTMKTLESSGDYDRKVSLDALRFDGHYDFGGPFKLDFGLRNSLRNADNIGFTLVTPVYAGQGASDPNGCLVRYVGADVVLNSGDCTAGNATGYFRGGPLSAQQIPNTPPPLASNWREYVNLLGSGLTFWGIDPRAIDDPEAYWRSLYPGTIRQLDPGTTWRVGLRETSGYVQADLQGNLWNIPYSGNVGVRVIDTNLHITQHLTGAPGAYGTEAADNGTQVTNREYWDYLPALNVAFDLTDSVKWRLAYSKNMMPLNLGTWGGGLTLNYSLVETPQGPLFRVAAGQSAGNPKLDPWRSTNYGTSLEWYINSTTMVSLALFRINVDSFIENGSVQNCTLPDEDGVVRNHCIVITEPVQGTGNSIHGAEFDYRQGFTSLPGLLSKTGMEFNFTYAPSDSGKVDLAGHKIPFQDNSTNSGNFILWFQNDRIEARVAYNYRSRRAVSEDEGSISGMELYEAPQKYVDASVSYKINKYAEVFVQGTNLTNEYQRFYLVWPDQLAHSNFFERTYMVGVRGHW